MINVIKVLCILSIFITAKSNAEWISWISEYEGRAVSGAGSYNSRLEHRPYLGSIFYSQAGGGLGFDKNNEYLDAWTISHLPDLKGNAPFSDIPWRNIYTSSTINLNYKIHPVAKNSENASLLPRYVPVTVEWLAEGAHMTDTFGNTSANAQAQATLSFQSGGLFVEHEFETVWYDDSVGAFSENGVDNILIDTLFGLDINLYARSRSSVFSSDGDYLGYGQAAARTYVDPIITIDPNWEYEDRFLLEYSYDGEAAVEFTETIDRTSITKVSEPTAPAIFIFSLMVFFINRYRFFRKCVIA